MSYKYAEILAAMAERAKVSETPWDVIQIKLASGWNQCRNMADVFDLRFEHRVKPRTIRIGNREVSEPLRVEDMSDCDSYWFPDLRLGVLVGDRIFYKSDKPDRAFENGLARRTEAEARELAEALLEVLNGNRTNARR